MWMLMEVVVASLASASVVQSTKDATYAALRRVILQNYMCGGGGKQNVWLRSGAPFT